MDKILLLLKIFFQGIFFVILMFNPVICDENRTNFVTQFHINEINKKFKISGVKNGYVVLDKYGRVKLDGEYENEEEVDKAFMIAQSIVGPKWVSPVTPENIKVRAWEKSFEKFMLRTKILAAKPTKKDTPPGPVRNKYALIVGIGKFKYLPERASLQYTVNDAKSLYEFVVDPRRGNFKRENTILLINEYATRNNIIEALNRIKSLAQEDDLVLIYVSTHGTPPDKYGGVHVVAYDTEINPPEKVWHTAVTDKIWRDFVEQTKAKRIILLLDTCYSNGAYKDIPGFLPQGGKSLGHEGQENYSISQDYAKRITGAKDLIVEETFKEINRDAKDFADFEEDGWGIVMISSSGPNEKSWESDNLKQSYFTYYFLEGLNKYKGSIKRAFFYAKPIVQQKVPLEKRYIEKGEIIVPTQTPHVYVTNKQWDIILVK